MSISDRIRVKDVRLLSDNWYTLKTTTFEWRRRDGTWQTQQRETYDRGNAAVILPYSLKRRTVVLIKQFRYPAYVNGYDELMIEAAAGLLDENRRKTASAPRPRRKPAIACAMSARSSKSFMSPGSVTEKLHFFVAEYEPDMKIGDGGGLQDEGEDIEVIEPPSTKRSP